MNAFERPLQAADRFQQRKTVLGFPVAVWSKFNEDQAGNLAALIAYYGFAALFPLLLLMVTVLDILLANNPSLRDDLLNSALAQYPVVGNQIKNSLGTIPGTGLPLIFGIVFLVLGARGVAGAMQNALCEIWGIRREERPGFPMSQLWAMALVFTIGIGFVVTTFLSGLAGGAGHLISGAGAHIGAVVVSLVLNIGVFWLGFRIATLFKVRWRDLRIGAVLAAVCWQALQVAGGYVVSHQLHRASELYGTFGIVLGLMAWLFLQAELTLYAAEVDVVLARRLWPKPIMADKAEQADEAQQTGGKDASPEGPSSLEEQPGEARQAAAGERPPVPSPRDEPPADAKRRAGQR
ncbi:MAG TPA: YihY/virulence factor BrkB family protein [Trebonia sp.]|jgi:membrane protein|nr:YihY/virulence factor BrkB family protein [Trebonia sp.]